MKRRVIKISDVIKEYCEQNGTTRFVMSEEVGVSYGTLQKLVNTSNDHAAKTQIDTVLRMLRGMGFEEVGIDFVAGGKPHRLDF